jgi:flagellar biosynthesis protein FlhF
VTLAVARRPAPAAARRPGERAFEDDVARRLRKSGASPQLIERVARAVSGEGGRHVIDRAAEALGRMFAIARLPRARGAGQVLAFAGPAGSGKTTSLSKLALRMVRAGRRVGLATLDTRRIGAVEGLRSLARLLGAPFFALRGADDLAAVAASGLELLLLDTTGRAAYDVRALAALRRALAAARWATATHLVLPATSSRAALAELQRGFEPLLPEGEPAGCVLTKLDETREPAPVLEHVLERGLPVAFLAHGPDLARHFVRAEPGRIADLLLRGRVA